ncbi:type IV toxin-antitoxin system AbiEi family antitoxin [Trinickia sp. EG282A]|uniref:type IV toxin-antitoxin system AbiEi family antitoxin n=1 Tax=Trinickia sp. EG282A TaxID=3237013 RepID=UPI0034D214CA
MLADTDDRRLLDPAALRDEWAINYSLRLLPKLNVQRFAVGDPSWRQQAELPAGQAWWSGEVAYEGTSQRGGGVDSRPIGAGRMTAIHLKRPLPGRSAVPDVRYQWTRPPSQT